MKSFVSAIILIVIASLAIGCGAQKTISTAADVANDAAAITQAAAPILHEQCTQPMEALATQPESPARRASGEALAKRCDPAELSYDGLRRQHILLLSLIAKATDGDGVTLREVFAAVEELTKTAGDLSKRIGEVLDGK